MLYDEVAVEQDGFDLREERVVAVEVSPSCLDHADLGVVVRAIGRRDEIGDGAAKEIGFGDKVSVENGDEFTLGRLETVFESAGFVTFAVGAMNVDDRHALGGVAVDAGAGDLASFVSGIVENLNVKQFARVIEARDSFDETLDHVAFVENRQLNGDAGPMFDFGRGAGDVFRIDIVVVDEPVAMQPVGGEDEKDRKSVV